MCGAGPAGIHFAHLLKNAKYKNVVVLEAEDRVGGKSHTKAMDSYPTVRHEVRCQQRRGLDLLCLCPFVHCQSTGNSTLLNILKILA
jgi:protoporphyrinogen oxidase